jgi:dihydrofolate synthase/folylpolyglutamate synthase
VGLSVSPHILDIRERFQINNELISDKEFYKYLNEIIPAVEEISKTDAGTPTYFEILIALAYYLFYKKGLDYAVMETGLGGTFDGTNVVSRADKIAIITAIGHDHTAILGKTLNKIAAQKAGIIQPKNDVVTITQHPRAMKVIKDVSSKQKSKLFIINDENIKNMSLIPNPKFDFDFQKISINNVELSMLGSFQVQNCSLALAATILLSKRDKFIFNVDKVRKDLKTAKFIGRMQKLSIGGQTLVIDGAHNPQKMAMFTKNLALYFPNQKFDFMVALKRGKDYKNILRYITPIAKKIVITSFFDQTKIQGMVTLAEDTNVISNVLDNLNFKNYIVCKDSKEALKVLFEDKSSVKIITGSLYLISQIYPNLIN